MWEAIARNRRRSWVLISLMGCLLVSVGFVTGMFIAPEGGAIGALVALGLWLVLFLVAMTQGDALLLMSSKARPVVKRQAPRLWNVVEEMTIAAGLSKMPRVFIIDEDAPNAFAVGNRPDRAAVAVTAGLLKRLDRDELQGVIAHEIGHIKNLDIRFMTIASVMVGSIALLSDVLLRSILWGNTRRRSSSSRGGGQGQLVVFAIALAVAVLAPIAARILYFACSRRREYLADASAARFTRYPDGLASALEKISVLATRAEKVNRALAPLYIVSPLRGLAARSLFATHPPTELRIKILRSMAGRAGYVDYEAAFKKLCRSSLIDARTLGSESSVETRPPSAAEKREDAVERIREVSGLLDEAYGFIPITCACGVRIKVPPGLDRDTVPCPRCGRVHEVPRAAEKPDAEAGPGGPTAAPAAPMTYRRRGTGWESFKCRCGKTVQLSPALVAPTVTCRSCKQVIEILPPTGDGKRTVESKRR